MQSLKNFVKTENVGFSLFS